ncbi:pyridoxamine 5'-phosphate oxidase family protein [Alteromonadaceae bacterium BrNp21-10]|nr:pyridoxamine 5'-phosphate oxidase family protein [Alteromonadaceae bacterium BrNp21-10]
MVLDAFHTGEQQLQQRIGVKDKMAELGQRFLRPYLLEQHRQFYALLPMIFIGAEDSAGAIWASVLYGEEGFVSSPNSSLLHIDNMLAQYDPLYDELEPLAAIGLLGIELPTKRRNRANGLLQRLTDSSMVIEIEQSFGNCAKYIQVRDKHRATEKLPAAAFSFTHFNGDIVDRIQQMDTFFIATGSLDEGGCINEEQGGMDISHRGGPPGYVQVINDSTLIFADFPGNNFFNTFGNLLLDPRAGLLFIDFEHGHHIYLTGTAEVRWSQENDLLIDGAEREVHFHLQQGKMVFNASPYRWQILDKSVIT